LAYFARPGIQEERRIRALRYWIVDLDAAGRWDEASKAVESFRRRDGRPPAIPNWHLARLWLALYGEGDWKKARETVRYLSITQSSATRPTVNLTAAQLPESAQPLAVARNKGVSESVFDVYYSRIFSPGYELQRQGSARVNEYFDRKSVP